MIKTLFTGLLLLFAMTSQSQNCSDFRTGLFKLSDDVFGKTIISRTETEQTETNKDHDVKMVYSINWTSKCSYELRPKKLLKGDPIYFGNPGDVIMAEIIKADDNTFTVKVTSNFSDQVNEFEMVKMK